MAAALLLSVAYGIDVKSADDPIVITVETALELLELLALFL